MTADVSLRQATVQDIQLELIRRSSFNGYDGERVSAALRTHRHLWRAALLDRPGLPDYTHPDRLLMAGLIKLRDLNANIWNADMLFVLTPTRDAARELARLADVEGWGEDIQVYEDQEEIDRALGTGRQEYGLLSIWWD